jgi:hypothetical protein
MSDDNKPETAVEKRPFKALVAVLSDGALTPAGKSVDLAEADHARLLALGAIEGAWGPPKKKGASAG